MEPTLATIDAESRLLLSQARHALSWAETADDFTAVVEIGRRGVVRLHSLERWAAREGITAEEATHAIRENSVEPVSPEAVDSWLFLTEARRKRQAGRTVYEMKLPDMAVFALFEQAEGPLTVVKGKGGGKSGKVLFIAFETFAELWGQSVLG